MLATLSLWCASFVPLNVAANDAAGTVCAEVKIEIEQQLTLERQAFDAHMKVVNGLESVALENVTVDVTFQDADGNVVEATSDPDNDTAEFFIRVDRLENIDTIEGGTIAGGTEANMHWLIVPSPGAADTDPNGTLYYVGAELEYDYGDQSESISVTPDSIRVKPMPALTLDYFLPRNVDSDDPLTDPVEPPIPFTLGVRVMNSGDGPANNLAIESAQPEIVENELGLPIDFRIIDSFVGTEPREPTLKIDFGSIDRDSARNGRWRMTTTYSGRFTEFNATFTHADEFGGELTSLLDAARTHELVGDVRVDAPGRDPVEDFLAYRSFPGNDGELRVYESNATDTAVTDYSADATLEEVARSPDTAVLEVSIPPDPGFAYARVDDPYDGAWTVDRVIRDDGKVLPQPNAWFATAYLSGGDRSHHLHLFDVDTPGTYTVEVKSVALDPGDPVIRFIPDKTTHEGGQVGFLVEAGDAAGNEPSLSMNGPGRGETFADNGDGTGVFDWSPKAGDAGEYSVAFTATRGDASTTRHVRIRVNPADDIDGDGLPDEWEMRHFGTLDRDGSGDYSGDGISDRVAFERGLDPTRRYNQEEFRAQTGTVIANDDWSRLPEFDAYAAPVVITGPGSFNDPDPGVVQFSAQSDGADRLRFSPWPHADGVHANETVSYLVAAPGSYVIDNGEDDLQIEVGTFELDDAGSWTDRSFQGAFPGTPTVLTTIQRDANNDRPLTTRMESVTPSGFRVGAFAQASDGGDPVIDVTVGYIALYDEDQSGTLPLLDRDVVFERFSASIAGDGVDVGGERLRRQIDGSIDGITVPDSAEPVAGIALDGHVFAASQKAGDAVAATLRSGPRGGESPVFNFARPSRIVSRGDDAVTLEIVRSGNTLEEGAVELDTISRTAIDGRDFAAADGRVVTFDAGQELKRVDIALLPDGNTRPSQAFDVSLTPVDSTSRTADPDRILVTVVDGATTDSDRDGMADVWEEHWFGGITSIDGSGDFDGDGTIDRRAFLEGLDPTAGEATPDWLHWQRRAVLSDDWSGVSIPGASGDEILISGVVSDYGDAPGVPRLRRGADGSIEARFRRWDGGVHGHEQVGLLAVDPGRHSLGIDSWEAGRVDGVDAETWHAVAFGAPFSRVPHVLVSMQDSTGEAAAVARVRNVTADGFEVRLSGTADAIDAAEVGYLVIGGAVASGSITIDERSSDYRVERLAVDHNVSTFDGNRFRLQPGVEGRDSWPVEMVDTLSIDGVLFAGDVSQAADGPVVPRLELPRDADNDGLPDRWELAHGLDPDRFEDATLDNDDDGASTLAEFIAGTDPQNPHEAPGPARLRMRAPLVSAWATRVSFGARYDQPVVITGAATDYDPEPGVVRLDFISSRGGRAYFEEWAYLDGIHGRERAPMLIAEAGRHLVDDSQVWEADTATIEGGDTWTHIAFDRRHDEIPRVIATPQTTLGETPRVARVRNVSRDGFEVALFAERGSDTTVVEQARIGYIAASRVERRDTATTGYLEFDGQRHRFRLERADIDHTVATVGRAQLRMQSERSLGNGAQRDSERVDIIRFDGGVFAQDVSYNDATPGTLRRITAASDTDLSPSEAFLVRHGLDPDDPGVGDLDVSGDGFSVLEEFIAGTDIFNPDDSPVRAKIRAYSPSVNDQWNTVSFARHYRDPVVIAGAASANDPEPGVVRLTGLDEASVQARFAEWDYLDGVHGFEDVPLLVMNAGRHLVDGSRIWEVGHTPVNGPQEWVHVAFDQTHASVPQVLVTTQTSNSDVPVVARVRNVTESGFEVALFGEAGGVAEDYAAERVGYLASSGTQSTGSVSWGGNAHPFIHEQTALTSTASEVEGSLLRLQGEASATPDIGHDEELVDVLVFDGLPFAQDVTFNDEATAVVRQGTP